MNNAKQKFNEQAGEMLRASIKSLKEGGEAPEGMARAAGMDVALVSPLTGEVIYARPLVSYSPMPEPSGLVETDNQPSNTPSNREGNSNVVELFPGKTVH